LRSCWNGAACSRSSTPASWPNESETSGRGAPCGSPSGG
jgi:hypothetical protein